MACLHARVQLADPAPEVRRGRAQALRGDATWRRRIERYERGETLIVALTASAVIDNDGQRSELRCFSHQVLWVDRPVASAVLRKRLLELAHRDFRSVAARMRDTGIHLSTDADSIAVQMVIDPGVTECLHASGAQPRPGRPRQTAAGKLADVGRASSRRRPQIEATHGS